MKYIIERDGKRWRLVVNIHADPVVELRGDVAWLQVVWEEIK